MAMPNLLSLQFLVPFTAAKIDFSRAIRGLRGMPRRLLLIGHKLDAGNAKLDTIQAVSTEADAVALYGEGSVLVSAMEIAPPLVAPSAMATISGLLPDWEMAMAAAPPSFSLAP